MEKYIVSIISNDINKIYYYDDYKHALIKANKHIEDIRNGGKILLYKNKMLIEDEDIIEINKDIEMINEFINLYI